MRVEGLCLAAGRKVEVLIHISHGSVTQPSRVDVMYMSKVYTEVLICSCIDIERRIRWMR
jgi:hypothetical protein